MGYLYGDSTPFPLSENYIEMTHDSIKVCSSLLAADETLQKIRELGAQEHEAAEQGLEEMKRMAADMSRSVEPYRGGARSSFINELSLQAAQTVRSLMDRAHRELTGRRDARLLKLEARAKQERERAAADLGTYLLRHELTKTQWSVVWTLTPGGEQAQAQAVASTPLGLEANFDLDLSSSPAWSRTIKVSDVKQPLVVNLPKKGGWLTSSKLREVDLSRYLLTRVRMTPLAATLTLHRTLKPSSPGFEVRIVAEGDPGALIKPLEGATSQDGQLALEGHEASALRGLWLELRGTLLPLCRQRVRMVAATLDSAPVSELEAPGKLAQRIIKYIAPHVREIAARSPVKGELALKREVKDGRREELFTSIGALTELFAGLGPERRALFDELGLGPAPEVLGRPEPAVIVDDGIDELDPSEMVLEEPSGAEPRPTAPVLEPPDPAPEEEEDLEEYAAEDATPMFDLDLLKVLGAKDEE